MGLSRKVLALVAVRADGIGGHDVLPAPERGSEYAGPDDDAPMIGRDVTHADIDAREAHGLLAHLDHHLAVPRLLEDGVPGPAAEDIRHVVEASGPADRTRHGGSPM